MPIKITPRIKGQQIRDAINGQDWSDRNKEFASDIKTVITKIEKIETAELKKIIDEIEALSSKDERLITMKEALQAIYEPRKEYKFLPVDSLNKKMLEILGEEVEGELESVKALRVKSLAIKTMLEEKSKIVKSRDKSFHIH